MYNVKWLQLATLSLLFVASRGLGLHTVRFVVLGVLGLAGLWMLHTLAQDFTKIYSTVNPGGGNPIRFFTKRQVNLSDFYETRGNTKFHTRVDFEELLNSNSNEEQVKKTEPPEIDWERILSRDPVGCARSFVCQLMATSEENMSKDETIILDFIRMSTQRENWATRELQSALSYGKRLDNPERCRKQYRFCPYSSKMMLALMKLFGGRGGTT